MMTCKNCSGDLVSTSKYCNNCGAKIVNERITLKKIWKNFAVEFFGWDNKYLSTAKKLFTSPDTVLRSYLDGVRKKFISPFAFLAIGAALAMLVFNQFSDTYVELSQPLNEQQFELIHKKLLNPESEMELAEMKAEYLQTMTDASKDVIQYFNLFAFLILPIYAFIAFIVFGKPHNYAEHLVINCYIQGFMFLVNIIVFFLSILFTPTLFFLSFPISILYYLYVYVLLNNYDSKTIAIKVLKFVGLLLIIPVIIFSLGFFIGMIS